MRRVGDRERRSRLALRHGLAPGARFADPVTAAAAMTALHATEAASVHLALWARVEGVRVADVDRALNQDRSLVKQLAMRRTLWAVPRDLHAAVLGSAAARVAQAERRRLVKDVQAEGLAEDGERWLEGVRELTLAQLADGVPRSVPRLRAAVPELSEKITRGAGRWRTSIYVATPVTTVLGAQGEIVRGPNEGGWWQPRPTWVAADSWLGPREEPWPEEAGYLELVRRWLWTFGPGTEDDLVWWLGSTRTAVRRALSTLGAVQVELDGGAVGWLRPDDAEPVGEVEPWAALLPTLDPTTMGWKGRDFHLAAEHRPRIFDSVGNAGTSAWWDGRIVGCWVQDEEGTVRVVLHEDVGRAGTARLDELAAGLTGWLDGTRVGNAYSSRQLKSASLP
ncbi:winged helix DNA-binding domain-containing protein [Nocardioides campestrisoli]|uniref:winged helix DNA-binding domain-containing protein n=1 Tax=Nocardioides campestrisoli TaxID=2736757 RepID=UPI00163DC0EC|nr:winged helix DNA-binding domain-containing protein [Nocardioides campestrisoli]